MSEFLYGPNLSARINKILSNKCTCIVSYIGNGAATKIKEIKKKKKKKKNVEIICNLKSNGTNPHAVEKLRRVLGRRKVKQMKQFHTKVYYSSKGAVVCSANFSTNGLEIFNEPAKQLEAGIYVEKDDPAYDAIVAWRKSLSGKIKNITKKKLKKRQEAYDKIVNSQKKKPKSKSSGRELTINDFLKASNRFGLFFYEDSGDVRITKDMVSVSNEESTIKEHMDDNGLDGYTEENYKPNTSKLRETTKKMRKKLLVTIEAKSDKDGLPISKAKDIDDQLSIFQHCLPVYITKTNEKGTLFFYEVDNKYTVSEDFKKVLFKRIKDSLKMKRERWIKWIKKTPEGDGWFMTIKTLKILI